MKLKESEQQDRLIYEDELVIIYEVKTKQFIEDYYGKYNVIYHNFNPNNRNYSIYNENGYSQSNFFITIDDNDNISIYNGYGGDKTINDVLDKYPNLENFILDLIPNLTVYSNLTKILSGIKVKSKSINTIDNNIQKIEYRTPIETSQVLISINTKDLIDLINFEDNSESESIIKSLFGSSENYYYGGSIVDNKWRIEEDWEEGYLFNYFNNENKGKVNEILNYFSALKVSDYNEKNRDVVNILNTHFKGDCEEILDKFDELNTEFIEEKIERDVKNEIAGILKKGKFIVQKIDKFWISVENLVKIYNEFGDETLSIKGLFQKLLDGFDMGDLTEDLFSLELDNEKFNEEISSILDDMITNIEENPEDFEMSMEYGKVIKKLKEMGYVVGGKYDLPKDKSKQFVIDTILEDGNKIKIIQYDGTKREIRSYSIDEFNDYLHSPELFEQIIKRLKKLL